jgi:hypothetical protein
MAQLATLTQHRNEWAILTFSNGIYFRIQVCVGVCRGVHVERMYLCWMWVDSFQLIYDGITDIVRTHSALQDVYIYIYIYIYYCASKGMFLIKNKPKLLSVLYMWTKGALHLACDDWFMGGFMIILILLLSRTWWPGSYPDISIPYVDLLQEKKRETLPMLRYV